MAECEIAVQEAGINRACIAPAQTGQTPADQLIEARLDQQRLLIGFRSLLHDDRAIIASVQNPRGIFEAGQEPRVATALDELDLGGKTAH